GCFATGAQVNEQQLATFEKGRTTYSEVVATLGTPTSQSLDAEGDRSASWFYFESKARPETFIPIVGPFIGGADSKTNIVVMYFDQRGVLTNFTSNSSQLGSGRGLSSGANMNRVADQPRQSNSPTQ